jgi:hypothetical protein
VNTSERELLKRTLDFLDSPVSFESGVCMCGDAMDNHSHSMVSGHTELDSGIYCAALLRKDIKMALKDDEL